MSAEFYKSVPRELVANLQFRRKLLYRCAEDERARQVMLEACKQDVLFWMSAFCFVFEPRPKIVNGRKQPNSMPFIPWDHQVPAILEIKDKLGYEDIGVLKSRGEGMSWMAVLFAVYDFLFDPMSKVGLVSRNELAGDSPDDPDSLGWKISWELSRMPRWMPGVTLEVDYERNLTKHTWKNLVNGSTIASYSATGDVASGGRSKWFLKDELAKFPAGKDREAMASTQHVTNSRLIVSTPKGTEGAYYDVMHEPSSMVKVTLHWTANPTRNRGLYRFENGKPLAVDPVNNPLPPSYDPPSLETLNRFSRLRRKGFKLEGKLRSAWYDHECDRPGATPQNIAQELDLDFGGSMYRVFGDEFFAAAEKEVRAPFHRGTLDYNLETYEPLFNTTGDGPCLLWTELDHRGKPPPHLYAAGADISTGLGGSYTSNSVFEVIDMLTMEQVFELATNTMSPTEFAEACVAGCKMFHDAYFGWESNGSAGGAFTKRMKELGYNNVYYRTQHTKRGRKKTKELGWLTTENTKGMMFGEFLRSVRNTELKIHSDMLVKECGQYIYLNGKIEHILAANTDDESSKGKAHGDRVIAGCVCLQAVRDRPLASKALQQEIASKVPEDSIAGRTRDFEDEKKRREEGEAWDDRTVWDLANGRNRYERAA